MENLQDEIWKPIAGYESFYEISSLGKVRRGNKLLKIQTKANLYKKVNLCIKNKQKNKHVHRLVAEAFIPNPENKPQVNHIDHNRGNNYLLNLEWVNEKENMQHMAKHGRGVGNIQKGLQHGRCKKVYQYTISGKFVREWSFVREAATTLKISENTISKVANEISFSAGGYQWKFYKQDEIGFPKSKIKIKGGKNKQHEQIVARW
jgi:hypothetical protein